MTRTTSPLIPVAARRRANLSAVLLDSNPALAGSRPALRTPAGRWTDPDLAVATGRMAAWLSRRGVRRGDVVLIALPDAPRWVALFLGAARAGAVSALAGHHLGAESLRALAARLRPALVAHDGPLLGPAIPRRAPRTSTRRWRSPRTTPGRRRSRARTPATSS